MLVGTNKRERQKRNRDSRRDQVTRRAQQGKLRKRGMQIAVVVLIVVALVGFVFATGNNSDDTAITETGVDTTEVLDEQTTDEAATEDAAFEFGTSECPPSDGSADQRREYRRVAFAGFGVCVGGEAAGFRFDHIEVDPADAQPAPHPA